MNNQLEVLQRAKQLFYDYIPTIECNKILTKEFGTKVRANFFWRKIFSNEDRIKHRHILCSQSKIGEKNPMKKDSAKIKSSNSHKGKRGWNFGLFGAELLKHYPNGKKGGRQTGYKHTLKSKLLMSKNMKGKKHQVIFPQDRKTMMSNRMKQNRQNREFNEKMYFSFIKTTKIETKIQDYLKELGIEYFTHQYMNIEHGYQCDILIPSIKLVIECDGDYWHKYPIGRDIDRVRTSELISQGFKVLRLWEHEIKVIDLNKFEEKLNNIK